MLTKFHQWVLHGLRFSLYYLMILYVKNWKSYHSAQLFTQPWAVWNLTLVHQVLWMTFLKRHIQYSITYQGWSLTIGYFFNYHTCACIFFTQFFTSSYNQERLILQIILCTKQGNSSIKYGVSNQKRFQIKSWL